MLKLSVTLTIILNLLLCPCASYAQDYPATYLGPGYRAYLESRIKVGYYVDLFTRLEDRQKQQVDKRNQIEDIVLSSYKATRDAALGIQGSQSQRAENVNILNRLISQLRQQRLKNAAANTAFYYVPHSDGKTVYFKDGLPTYIENERAVDELGNLQMKDSFNMQYNSKRLLTSYEATLKDGASNNTYLYVYGIKYSPNSVFYAGFNEGRETKAHKNEIEKYTVEIDPTGNVRRTHWQALDYTGKLLRSFHQQIEDSLNGNSSFTRTNITYANNNYQRASSYFETGTRVDGLEYSLKRSDISYNSKEQVKGYREETSTTNIDGSKTSKIVEAQFKYLNVGHQFGKDVKEPAPDRLLESIITATTINADGSERTETITTNYDYDANHQLTGTSGNSVFVGRDAGNRFSGTSTIQFEIIQGKAMAKQVDARVCYYGRNISPDELLRVEDSTTLYHNGLVSNLPRLVSTFERTEISDPLRDPDNIYKAMREVTTTYVYDASGNLTDAQGQGQASGYEYSNTRGWWGKHTSTITIDYVILLNKALRETYHEVKDYTGGVE